MRLIKILIAVIIISLSFGRFYLYGQEKQDTRVDTRERYQEYYLKGKEFYSQGRYEEATAEFEKAFSLISPSTVEFMEKVQKEQVKISAPASAEFKIQETLTDPSELQFMEKVQKEEERTFVPRPTVKPVVTSKEKLTKKKKTEEQKEEPIVTNKIVVPEESEPEIEESEYYIDVGDVLDISVWQIPDLSRPEVIVRPDGKISFPLIGDIKTGGLTLTRLDNIITEKLKTYVKTPEVSIMIRRFGEQANKVVILGEIFGPGVYKFSSRPTIAEAIASAGGYTKYAVLNSIMVISGDVRTHPEVMRVNFAQIIKRGNLTENIILKPNDIVYVPRSFIGNVNTFLELLQPAISEYMQTMNARHFHNVMHRN